MKFYALAFLLLSSLLAGCAGSHFSFPGRYQRDDGLDLEGLLHFQGEFADRSAASRSQECRWLLTRQQESPQAGQALRLMIGRTLSESCGDPARLIHSYERLADRNAVDQRVTWMADYLAAVLKRAGSTGRRSAAAVGKQKGEAAQKPGKDDLKLLREKLEAIRSLEKKMDESITDDNER